MSSDAAQPKVEFQVTRKTDKPGPIQRTWNDKPRRRGLIALFAVVIGINTGLGIIDENSKISVPTVTGGNPTQAQQTLERDGLHSITYKTANGANMTPPDPDRANIWTVSGQHPNAGERIHDNDPVMLTLTKDYGPIRGLVRNGDSWLDAENKLVEAGYSTGDYAFVTDDNSLLSKQSDWSVTAVDGNRITVHSAKATADAEAKKAAEAAAAAQKQAEEESKRKADEEAAAKAAEEAAKQQQAQTQAPSPAPTIASTPSAAAPSTGSGSAYYANCAAARAAGAAPIYRGQPGYSSKLDRDGDGVACE